MTDTSDIPLDFIYLLLPLDPFLDPNSRVLWLVYEQWVPPLRLSPDAGPVSFLSVLWLWVNVALMDVAESYWVKTVKSHCPSHPTVHQRYEVLFQVRPPNATKRMVLFFFWRNQRNKWSNLTKHSIQEKLEQFGKVMSNQATVLPAVVIIAFLCWGIKHCSPFLFLFFPLPRVIFLLQRNPLSVNKCCCVNRSKVCVLLSYNNDL